MDWTSFFDVAFSVFWGWRILSFLYSCHSLASTVPDNLGVRIKNLIMLFMMVTTTILHVLPLDGLPRLRLMNTVLSIPSQINTIIFVDTRIAPIFNSLRVTMLFYLMSLLSILETVYLIHVDWQRIKMQPVGNQLRITDSDYY